MKLSMTEPQLVGAGIGDTVYVAQEIYSATTGTIAPGTVGIISDFDGVDQEVGVEITIDGSKRTIWRHPNYFDTTRPFMVGDEVSEDEISELPVMTIIVQKHTNKACQVSEKGTVLLAGSYTPYNPEGLTGVIVWMP